MPSPRILLLIGTLVATGLSAGACGDDAPADVGEPCTLRSDCEKMCRPICDPAPCTMDSTSFVGECSDRIDCSYEIGEEGEIEPTPCP